MSHSFAEQPLLPGDTSAPQRLAGEPIRRMESFYFIFRESHWVMSVLLTGLCALSTQVIPIVGFIILMGYLCELFDSLELRMPGYPAFDFNRLGPYLSRGVWPFLAALIMQLVMMAIIFPLGFGGFLAVMAIGTSLRDGQEAVLGVGFTLLGILVLAAIIGMNMIMTPVVLRAMIRQDLNDLFEFGFIREFVKRTWKELIVCVLFTTASSLVLMVVGTLAFCVGMYFTLALVYFSSTHLTYQLYDLYVARGGMPVPRKQLSPIPSVNPSSHAHRDSGESDELVSP